MKRGKQVKQANEKIRLGMVGGGKDAFIGNVHRIASRIDDKYDLVAGVLSSTYQRSLDSGLAVGISEDRIYRGFSEMAQAEATRADGIEAVAIVTPNHLHFAACKAFLENGIHVICDKPVTTTLSEAFELEKIISESGCHFLLTHNYSAYPMIREARRLVAEGELGTIRLVNVEYIQDWLAADSVGKQAEWRMDPTRAGAGGCIGDIGTHAYQLGQFVSGLEPEALSADLHSFGEGRVLDDNAHIKLRFKGGARGLIWASQIAIGNENGVKLRIIGDKGGLEFFQEDPNKLWCTKLGEAKTLLTRGGAGFMGSVRIPAGHPEGFLEGFATLYDDFAQVILGRAASENALPGISDGIAGLRFIEAAVQSSQDEGRWVEI
jgi:predicted dehydrogenase